MKRERTHAVAGCGLCQPLSKSGSLICSGEVPCSVLMLDFELVAFLLLSQLMVLSLICFVKGFSHHLVSVWSFDSVSKAM